MDKTPPFIGFLLLPTPLPPCLTPPPEDFFPQGMLEHQWTLGAHQTPFPNRPIRATPFPKGCWGRISGRWGRIRPPPPTDRYEHPFPQQTGRYEQPLPPKDAGGASSVDAGGASTPSPNRPVRAPSPPTDRYEHPLSQQTGTSNPFPQRMPGAHHQGTLGAHQTPSPNRPVRATPSPNRPVQATPSPNPPPPYIKGLLIGHTPSFYREPLWTSLHPLSQVKVK